jgi:hypothetical protein
VNAVREVLRLFRETSQCPAAIRHEPRLLRLSLMVPPVVGWQNLIHQFYRRGNLVVVVAL